MAWALEDLGGGRVRLVADAAVLGHTDAADTTGRIGPRDSQRYFEIDVRGDSYFVESHLYPGGTIPTPTTPTSLSPFPGAPPKLNHQVVWNFRTPPAGSMMNRGWAIINGARTNHLDTRGTAVEGRRTAPHLLSTHSFFLGRFGPDSLSPESIITSGVENGDDADAEVVFRAVTGGTGRFRFARGQVQQIRLGRNTTTLRTFSQFAQVFAPNYRFVFDLVV
jgi:hypothetical protein